MNDKTQHEQNEFAFGCIWAYDLDGRGPGGGRKRSARTAARRRLTFTTGSVGWGHARERCEKPKTGIRCHGRRMPMRRASRL